MSEPSRHIRSHRFLTIPRKARRDACARWAALNPTLTEPDWLGTPQALPAEPCRVCRWPAAVPWVANPKRPFKPLWLCAKCRDWWPDRGKPWRRNPGDAPARPE